jgi:ubiquinone/menaquinone biosynthesis C-methylase UbiE
VIAAWMLYHVPDLDRGLAEIWRVLRPGGRLLAVTNSERHLEVLWQLVGIDRLALSFSSENGRAILERHFTTVEQCDVEGVVSFADPRARVALRGRVAGHR